MSQGKGSVNVYLPYDLMRYNRGFGLRIGTRTFIKFKYGMMELDLVPIGDWNQFDSNVKKKIPYFLKSSGL